MSNEELKKEGSISVEAENIFPVIKKWLYSDKEIFLREIVSNACDAVTKMKRLASLGEREEQEGEHFRVDVVLDKENKTLSVMDNGVGMTHEEVDRYICNIALSGAMEFMEKYEKDSAQNGIIGHFGLGFYSAFMVSERVEVLTRSYKGGETTLWICDENGNYSYEKPEMEREGGTDVILHLSEEGTEFLDGNRILEILEKYCAFMPVEIYFTEVGKEKKEGEEEKPINDPHPLWLKNPSECTEEEYKAFYRKVFKNYKDPLFHIHINVDYPLSFKGILYFPKINNEFDSLEGQVKLYYNQVFVADNIKEVIPEYFLMLKGVLDCPELPLNVSRSYLQNSGYVTKISAHIVKKTADKLCGMFNTDRPSYEKIWKDLKVFMEYGCLKDKKFYDRVKDVLLYELTDGSFVTLKEYKESVKDKQEGKICYCTDKTAQAQYIGLYEAQGVKVALLDRVLDSQFIQMIENLENVKFFRVDAELTEALKGEGEAEKDDSLEKILREVSGNEELSVRFAPLKDETVPAVLNVSEDDRRMKDMMKMYGMDSAGMKDKETLVVNSGCPLTKKLLSCTDEEKKKSAAEQLYYLTLLSQRPLTAEEMKTFLQKSFRSVEEALPETPDKQ